MSGSVTVAQRLSDRRTRAIAVVGAIIIVLLVRLVVTVISEAGADGDALSNVRAAHALATTGAIREEGGALSMYREPLPNVAYALQLRFDPRLDGVTLQQLDVGGPEIRALKQQHVAWAALLLVGVALQVWRLVPWPRRIPAAAAAVVLVQLMFVEVVADGTVTELHAATFVVWIGLVAQQLVQDRRRRDIVALGLLLGLAALTKSALLYVGATFVIVLGVLTALRVGGPARSHLLRVVAVLLVLSVIVLPWMGRNAANFGAWAISDRGGLSLWYRAIYEDATGPEIRGSWYAFTPGPLQPLASRLLGVDDADLDGPLRRAHRFHPDEEVEQRSLYSLARLDRFVRTEANLEDGSLTRPEARVRADQELLRDSLDVLRADPLLFIMTAPMFLWRGTWIIKDTPLVPRVALGVLNPLGMLLLLGAGLHSVLARRPGRFAVVGLPFGLVMFNALLTMYEPRFSEPALPTMIVLMTVGAARLAHRYLPARAGSGRV